MPPTSTKGPNRISPRGEETPSVFGYLDRLRARPDIHIRIRRRIIQIQRSRRRLRTIISIAPDIRGTSLIATSKSGVGERCSHDLQYPKNQNPARDPKITYEIDAGSCRFNDPGAAGAPPSAAPPTDGARQLLPLSGYCHRYERAFVELVAPIDAAMKPVARLDISVDT